MVFCLEVTREGSSFTSIARKIFFGLLGAMIRHSDTSSLTHLRGPGHPMGLTRAARGAPPHGAEPRRRWELQEVLPPRAHHSLTLDSSFDFPLGCPGP